MSESNWMVYNKKGNFKGLAKRLGIDPVIARILVNKDIDPKDMETYLHPEKGVLNDAYALKDVRKAAEIITSAIKADKHIRIIGDYDVDGIFAAYILVEGIRALNANISYDIPHRITDGYGMNKRLVEKANADGVDLIITCDNGIKALDEVKLAKKYKMQVVVTDHHEIGFDGLPEADAVINPHRSDCDYPFKEICGAYVAQKLIYVLYDMYGIKEKAKRFLPFAAFATVGDIMPLCDENRTLVYNGLLRLRSSGNTGLQNLIDITLPDDKPIGTFDVGFVLGPCFNAAGRLDSAKRGLELLLEKDEKRAYQLALELKELNERRKSMTEEGAKKAADIIEAKGELDKVIVEYVPGLHESLAGIVAGRIKEKYYRPTFIFTDANEGIKGSGRSIPGYSMAGKLHDAEDLITRYGGHPMAAGVSMPKENLNAFRARLNELCELSDDELKMQTWIDVPMPIGYVTKDLIKQLDLLEPFGEGNERPLFATKDVTPVSARYLGRDRLHIKFFLEDDSSGMRIEAVYFRYAAKLIDYLKEKYGKKEVDKLFRGEQSDVALTITYYPQINIWQGRESLQIRIEDYK